MRKLLIFLFFLGMHQYAYAQWLPSIDLSIKAANNLSFNKVNPNNDLEGDTNFNIGMAFGLDLTLNRYLLIGYSFQRSYGELSIYSTETNNFSLYGDMKTNVYEVYVKLSTAETNFFSFYFKPTFLKFSNFYEIIDNESNYILDASTSSFGRETSLLGLGLGVNLRIMQNVKFNIIEVVTFKPSESMTFQNFDPSRYYIIRSGFTFRINELK